MRRERLSAQRHALDVMPGGCACVALARYEHLRCGMSARQAATPTRSQGDQRSRHQDDSAGQSTMPRNRGRGVAHSALGATDLGRRRDGHVERVNLGEQRPDVRAAGSQAQEPRQQTTRLGARSAVLAFGVDELGRAIPASARDRSRPRRRHSIFVGYRHRIQCTGSGEAARLPVRWCEVSRLTAHRAAFPTVQRCHYRSRNPIRNDSLTFAVAWPVTFCCSARGRHGALSTWRLSLAALTRKGIDV